MPADPSPAQQQASRINGARSRGPSSPEGRERIAAAATRHGLLGAFRLLPGEEELFASLRADYWRRLRPNDAAEAAAVDKIVMALWRERRLEVIENRLALALATGGPTDGLPSLATLIRYRARIARDRQNGEEELARLRRLAAGWSRARSATAGPAAAAEGSAEPAGEPAVAGGVLSANGPAVVVPVVASAAPAAAPAGAPLAAGCAVPPATAKGEAAAAGSGRSAAEDERSAVGAVARGEAGRPRAAADRAYRALLDEIGRELALLARAEGAPLPPVLAAAPGARQLGPLLAEAFRAPLTTAELGRLEAAARRGAAFRGAGASLAGPAPVAA